MALCAEALAEVSGGLSSCEIGSLGVGLHRKPCLGSAVKRGAVAEKGGRLPRCWLPIERGRNLLLKLGQLREAVLEHI